jgi:hypothetical protein
MKISSIDSSKKNQDDKINFKKQFLQELHDLAVDSTSHGFPRIFKSAWRKEWLITILWSVLFLASFIYCVYSIVVCFETFLMYGVTATISRVQNLPATFPAITICNINAFNEAYVTEYIFNKTELAKCFYTTNGTVFEKCMNTLYPNKAFYTFNDNIKRIVANDKELTETDHYWYGYDLHTDMLISCNYNGVSCNSSDFVQYWDNVYGNCYTFNKGDKPLVTSSPGDNYGLQLELIVSK